MVFMGGYMNLSLLVSLLYFIIFGLSFLFGIYIININPGELQNKVFFGATTALAIWSLGLSIANSAPDSETFFLWFKISLLGSTAFFGILLRLYAVSTLKNINSIFLIYAPSMICLYAIIFTDKISPSRYDVILTDAGWAILLKHSGYILLSIIYFVVYTIACLILLFIEKKKTSNKHIRIRINIVIISLLASLFLSSFMDLFLMCLSILLPQSAPLFFFLHIAVVFYFLKKNKGAKPIVGICKANHCNSNNKVLHNYLALVYLAGGTLTFSSYYLPDLFNSEMDQISMLIVSTIFLLMSPIIYLSKYIENDLIRKFLILMSTLFSIPLVTLLFVEHGGITAWTLPIVILMVFLFHNTKLSLALVTATAIVTQIVVWIYAPKGAIYMDEFDYIIRIALFLFILWFGYRINSKYMAQEEDNRNQAVLQDIIIDVTSNLINKNQSDSMDNIIEAFLSTIGSFHQADRAFVSLLDNKKNNILYSYEWCNDGITPLIGNSFNLSTPSSLWVTDRLQESKLFCIGNPDDFSNEASQEKELMYKYDAMSMLAAPIEINSELIGYIGLTSVSPCKAWPDFTIRALKIYANLLAGELLITKNNLPS